MAYTDGVVVRSITSPDGKRRLDIIQRPEGICRYVEHALEQDMYAGGEFWNEIRHSGLFADPEAAEKEALSSVSWRP